MLRSSFFLTALSTHVNNYRQKNKRSTAHLWELTLHPAQAPGLAWLLEGLGGWRFGGEGTAKHLCDSALLGKVPLIAKPSPAFYFFKF